MNLKENPFFVLGAKPQDSKHRIVQLCEEQSLFLDPQVCEKARAALLAPRSRLTAELTWLPGVDPNEEPTTLVDGNLSPEDILQLEKLLPVARANLLAHVIHDSSASLSASEFAKAAMTLSRIFDAIDVNRLIARINADRTRAEMPSIPNRSLVDDDLKKIRKQYANVLRGCLDNLATNSLIRSVTALAEKATSKGTTHAPILIDDLIDQYEVSAQHYLDAEAENITAFCDKLKELSSTRREQEVMEASNVLVSLLETWDSVAQPIQVSMMSRGLDHEASC